MPKIAHSTIDEVNDRTDIIALIGEYTRLERRGGDYWGCCPFHNEKTPSFHVLPDKKMYHCFGCGAGGTVIKFYMEMEKASFTEAVTALAKKNGIPIEYEGNEVEYKPEENKKELYKELYSRVAGTFRYFLTSTDQGAFAKNYLESRGVSEEIAEKFKLGYAPQDRFWLRNFLKSKNYSDEFLNESGLFSKKNPAVSFFSDRLIFPIFDRAGKTVAFGGRILHGDGPKYLNSGDLIQYKKGETLFAFNFAKQEIRQTKSVILCEGYMDVIAYHQAGITQAVAPLGTALTQDQLKILKPFADTVLLSFDNDGAGQKATWKAVLMARKEGFTVKIIQLSGGKDPSEILQQFGKDSLTNAVNGAILDSDFLLISLAKKYNINSPEGKAKASLEFFDYVDVLQSDIQKESSLEQLSQTYQLNPEAVKSDFENRSIRGKRAETKAPESEVVRKVEIKPTAEVRAVLAVISNTDYFPLMRNSLTADDFEDVIARDMFITLEECFREDSFSYDNILEKCSSDELKKLIAKAVTTGEFTLNSQQAVEDSIKMVRYNSLLRKREHLTNSIRQLSSFQNGNLETEQKLNALVTEKINIDTELQKMRETNK